MRRSQLTTAVWLGRAATPTGQYNLLARHAPHRKAFQYWTNNYTATFLARFINLLKREREIEKVCKWVEIGTDKLTSEKNNRGVGECDNHGHNLFCCLCACACIVWHISPKPNPKHYGQTVGGGRLIISPTEHNHCVHCRTTRTTHVEVSESCQCWRWTRWGGGCTSGGRGGCAPTCQPCRRHCRLAEDLLRPTITFFANERIWKHHRPQCQCLGDQGRY